jgi:pilus assembly protein CpaF
MIGLGPPEPFLDDDQITDILANGPSDIYVERRGKLEKTGARFRDAAHLVNIAQRVAAAVGASTGKSDGRRPADGRKSSQYRAAPACPQRWDHFDR